MYRRIGLSESMAYELDPFGIKIFLVEPGAIRTNFFSGMISAKKSQDPNSPYSQVMQNVARAFEHILEDGSSADVVAKVVPKAVTSENSGLRHLAGNDAEKWMEEKRSKSDEDFHRMMNQLMK